jgi:hypothetical protein
MQKHDTNILVSNISIISGISPMKTLMQRGERLFEKWMGGMSGEVALEIFKRLDQKESRGITKCQTFQKWEISSTVTRYFS